MSLTAVGQRFRPRRPSRYLVALAITLILIGVLAVSAVLDYINLEVIPSRTALFGLPVLGLVAGASYVGIRALGSDPEHRRRALIRASVYLGIALMLWLLVIDVFTFTQAAGPLVAVICAAACVPTTGFGLWVLRRLDRNEAEPWRLVMVAAAWGAVVATSLVIWGETVWDDVTTNVLLPGPGLDTSTAFSAGLLEEIAKGLAVVLLFLVMRDEFDGIVDGIVYGAAVGMGFNFMESISYMTHLYAIFQPHQGVVAAGVQWYARQVLGLFFGHATYTALIGAGLGIARQLRGFRPKLITIGSGWLIAIAGHFSWDAWLTFFPISHGAFALFEVHLRTIVMEGPFTAAVVILLVLGLHIESEALARQLRAEAAEGKGAVEEAEVPRLTSFWNRALSRFDALRRGGFRAYRQVARLQQAQLELAMERWHRERQVLDSAPGTEDMLREQIRLLRSAAAVR
jgi:RsiW-degrading membrane proteinase PrsW (M82 family)